MVMMGFSLRSSHWLPVERIAYTASAARLELPQSLDCFISRIHLRIWSISVCDAPTSCIASRMVAVTATLSK